ncbi:MAG: alpha/beta hydrolase [Anaerolineales bacterium]
MGIEFIKIIPSFLAGVSVLFMGAPVLGEMVATRAPWFSARASYSPRELGLSFEEVSFRNEDNLLLRGWFFPAETECAPAVLYAPPTSSDQRSGLPMVEMLHDAGYSALLFSYRGHGESEGDPWGFTYGAAESRDVDAAVRFLKEQRGVERIAAVGHSAGAVAVMLSAARNPDINAVVAASPFVSIESVWQTNRPSWIPQGVNDLYLHLAELRKGFSRMDVNLLEVISRISPRPVLIVHGENDRRVTLEQARAIYQSAQAPKTFWLLEGVNHHRVRELVLGGLSGRVVNFLDGALSK